MEKLRVAKVDSVLLQRRNGCCRGTLHLTQHHLIFIPDSESGTSSHASTSYKRDEIWFPYSLLWLLTRLPSILPLESNAQVYSSRAASKRIYPLLVRLRNFENAALGFETESLLTDVFESIKACIIAAAPEDLYAYFYEPRPPLPLAPQGWYLYDALAEFKRQGVGTRTKAWRFCEVNTGYGFCSTYPSHLCVPSRISDTVIRHAGKYRSKERIPSLTYLHHSNLASITRSSQPLVGLNNRSMQDEKLIEAIFTSHLFADPESSTAKAALAAGMNNVAGGNAATERGNVMAIYGATTTNLIIDARPTTNAMANRAKGAGTENMEHYKGCKKVYLGVDNIHVMRDSLQRVTNALRASEAPWTFGFGKAAATTYREERTEDDDEDKSSRKQVSVLSEREAPPLDHVALKRSQWLKHISALLEGTLIITKNVHVNNSHVLIHCSDGWDRTSQLAALAQLCLDPYYRTMQGFAVLVEKDWCSFGHRFWDRCGHASSEKYFETAQGYGEENSEEESNDEGVGAGFEAQAAANAIWGFTKSFTANFQSSSEGHSGHGRSGAHLKEVSPVFHQFLDCTWQIMRQFPKRFEFNERWLLDLFDTLYECKYGTFLYNSEGERNGLSAMGMKPKAANKTQSVWDYMLDKDRRLQYSNTSFDASLDTDTKRKDADLGVLMINSKDVGFWGGLFRRSGNEMNKLVQAEAEERRRLLEMSESENRLAESDQSKNDVEGITNGIVVQSLEDDPVMRGGVVDLAGGALSYQPYQPRSKSVKDGKSDALVKSSTPSPQITSFPPDGASDNSNQDTTAKMKTLFSGWGAKLQDAYNNVVTNEVQDHAAPTTSNRREQYADLSTSKAELADKPLPAISRSNGASRSGHLPSVDSNPWITSNPVERGRSELTDMIVPATVRPKASAAKQEALSVDAISVSKPSSNKKEEASKVAFDPLGVGII